MGVHHHGLRTWNKTEPTATKISISAVGIPPPLVCCAPKHSYCITPGGPRQLMKKRNFEEEECPLLTLWKVPPTGTRVPGKGGR
jgi:hypothetical protein